MNQDLLERKLYIKKILQKYQMELLQHVKKQINVLHGNYLQKK